MEKAALFAPLPGRSVERAEGDASPETRLRAAVEQNFDSIWRLLRRLGVPEEHTHDAAQQVFLVASRRMGSIRAGSERPFLLSTAVRVAVDVRRSIGRERARTEPFDELRDSPEGRPDPEALLEQKRARALLDEVLEAMAPDLRSAFVLFEIEELPMPEIAAALGIPTGTVASRLRRAREEFQDISRRMEARARGPRRER